TYRLGSHTTADDATRYRDAAEVEAWRAKDPVQRFQRFLTKRDLLTAEQDQQLIAEVEAEINAAVTEAEAMPTPAPDAFFDYAEADLSPRLQEQRAELLHYSQQSKPGRS
ncbi:MAG TPA: thiamine pyrophosphate-dependent enzyme, partial [Ktedonobacteraceae bacterium]|nr:thiamine pyrophosphate-dependent enzyme [Ktedonobacteraceae bacterium]